jgi:hypothetical protein
LAFAFDFLRWDLAAPLLAEAGSAFFAAAFFFELLTAATLFTDFLWTPGLADFFAVPFFTDNAALAFALLDFFFEALDLLALAVPADLDFNFFSPPKILAQPSAYFSVVPTLKMVILQFSL